MIRIFVSSTFSDLEAERNALQQRVFPRLEDLCRGHGLRFQAIDLRWGVSEEAGQDQQTLGICLGEIERCQRTTRRPNFIVLLGDRYGWQPLPSEIPAAEWVRLIAAIVDGEERALLSSWYVRDDNALAPVYVIRPRQGEYLPRESWTRLERWLQLILRRAAEHAALDDEAALKYFASATEQEIYYGALQRPEFAQNAFCFLRTIRDLPDDGRAAKYVDVEESGRSDTDSVVRLRLLKQRLRSALGANVREYEAGWNGADITLDHLDRFCAEVYDCLARTILEETRAGEDLDPIAQEGAIHARFGAQRAERFTARTPILLAIDGYLRSDAGRVLAIIGAAGVGKSALLAKACEGARRAFPRAIVGARFIGATAESFSVRRLLAGLCGEIDRACGLEQGPAPTDYQELIAAFRAHLELATKARPIVLFLDGIDQISDVDHALNLAWLPAELPAHARLIVSALPSLEPTLAGRTSQRHMLVLEPMSREEGAQLLELWLTDSGRTLQPQQREAVLGNFVRNGLPLYLKFAFEACRRWRSYDSPGDLGGDVPEIIDRLFSYLCDPARHGRLLVERSLAYIAAGKNGLAEDELLRVLSLDSDVWDGFVRGAHHQPLERQLPAVLWSRLYFDLANYLTERAADGGSVLTFYHRQLADVVSARYLGGKTRKDRHRLLAAYFLDQPDDGPNLRKLSELPYQQAHGEDWPAFERTLTDFAFMQTKVSAVGPQALIEDYDLQDVLGQAAPAEGMAALRTLQRSVRLSAHVLAVDSAVLRSHLHGRLSGVVSAPLQVFVDGLAGPAEPWLRMLAPTLQSPQGALLRTFSGDHGVVLLTFTPSGRRAVSAAFGDLSLWDLEQGTLARTLGRYQDPLVALLAVDEERVLWASTEELARSCDLTSGAISSMHIPPQEGVLGIALSLNGARAAVATAVEILVWDLGSGTVVVRLPYRCEDLWSMFLSATGRYVAMVEGSGRVAIWDTETRTEVAHLNIGQTRVVALRFIEDAQQVAIAFSDHAPTLLDLVRQEYSHPMQPIPDDMFAMSGDFDAQGRRAALISRSHDALEVWDATRGQKLLSLGRVSVGDSMQMATLAMSADGKRVLTASETGEFRLWQLEGSAGRPAQGHERVVRLLVVSPDGRHVVTGANDGIRVWSLEDFSLRLTLNDLRYVHDVAVSPHSDQVMAMAGDELIWWDIQTGMELRRRKLTRSEAAALDKIQPWETGRTLFTPDARGWIVALSESTCAHDLEDEAGSRTFPSRCTAPSATAVSADGARVATLGYRQAFGEWLEVWNLATGEMMYETGLPLGGPIDSLDFSTDPDCLILAVRRLGIVLWSCSSNQVVRTLERSDAGPHSPQPSPDGQLVVAALHKGPLRVWDLAAGRALASFDADDHVTVCGVASDSATIVCGDAAGRVHFLRLVLSYDNRRT